MRKPQSNWKQIALVAIFLIAAIGVLIALSRSNEAAQKNAPAAHDHNGDGVPDHGDEAH